MPINRQYLPDPLAVAAAAHAAGMAAAYSHHAERAMELGQQADIARGQQAVQWAHIYQNAANQQAQHDASIGNANTRAISTIQREREKAAADAQKSQLEHAQNLERDALNDQRDYERGVDQAGVNNAYALQRIQTSHELGRGDFQHELEARDQLRVDHLQSHLSAMEKERADGWWDTDPDAYEAEKHRILAEIDGVKQAATPPAIKPTLQEDLEQNGDVWHRDDGSTLFRQPDGKIEFRPPPKKPEAKPLVDPKSFAEMYAGLGNEVVHDGPADKDGKPTGRPLTHGEKVARVKEMLSGYQEVVGGSGSGDAAFEAYYGSLKPGAQYVAPDGSIRTKGK